jgi:uncharacterized protein
LTSLDWMSIRESVLVRGYGCTGSVLTVEECAAVVKLNDRPERFRKRIEMEGHSYGRGDYAYFARPLPRLVSSLRTGLYRHLVPLANRFAEELGWEHRYPSRLDDFVAECAAKDQLRSTPLLLHYSEGGYNRLHQDRYGDVFFPLQVVALLSAPGEDFAGGELLIAEGRPRVQPKATVISPERGELVVIPSMARPGPGKRGSIRWDVRHGVSTVTRGERFALGIIFHDAA